MFATLRPAYALRSRGAGMAVTRNLVLLTHGGRTVPPCADTRVAAGLPMPGVFLVTDDTPVGQAIDDLLIAANCLSPDECKDIVRYFLL